MIINGFAGKDVFNGSGNINWVDLSTFSFSSANAHTINVSTTSSADNAYWQPANSGSFVMPNAYALYIVINSVSWTTGTITRRSSNNNGSLGMYVYITTQSYSESAAEGSTTSGVPTSIYLSSPYISCNWSATTQGTAMNLSSITPSISTTASTGSFGMIEVNSDLTFIRRKFNTSNGTHVFTVGNTYYLTLQCSQSAGSYAAYVQNAKITASMSVKYIPA